MAAATTSIYQHRQAMNVVTGDGKGTTEAPKRVSGGLVLKAKKKKRRRIGIQRPSPRSAAPDPRSRAPGGPPPSSGVPRILSSVPPSPSPTPKEDPPPERDDEFGDDALEGDGGMIDVLPSDALLCLRAYTRPPPSGGTAEGCAYCPIFTREEESGSGDGGGSSRSTHAAPFLPRHVLIHLLDAQSRRGASSSSTARVEREIQRLADANEVRLLQLHGTAATAAAGNDEDEDVAVMETSSYLAAAEMALRTRFEEEEPAEAATRPSHSRDDAVRAVHAWLASAFLPRFAGRTWISTGALDAFCDEARCASSSSRTRRNTERLVDAGLLLPRRGLGPGAGAASCEGHWISLPGLGRAARSVADGRANLLRRLRSSRYRERKRSVLEFEIGRPKPRRGSAPEGRRLEQAGRFVVLDALATGWACIRTTCAGEQFVRLAEE